MWTDIIGHAGPIEILKSYIESGKIPHALLFAGQKGIGKSIVAHEYFKAINCLNTPGDGCGMCASCLKADNRSHPDLIWLKSTIQWIKVEDIRSIQKDISLRPFEAKSRVVIIEPAELLNEASSNALLKTLEEPPDSTLFVLISHKPNLLLPTIVSRCQMIRYSPIDVQHFADTTIDPFVVKLTSGAIGSLANYNEEQILEIRNGIIEICKGAEALHLVSKIIPASGEAKEFVHVFLAVIESVLRDIMVLLHGGNNVINEDLKDIPLKHVKYDQIEKMLDCTHNIRRGVGENINLKVALSDLFILLGNLSVEQP